MFLYLKDSNVEKTTGIAERHFSVMSWLLEHRFRTREGLLRMSLYQTTLVGVICNLLIKEYY